MMLLPPPKDTCPICAVKHKPEEPHNAQSLYYQYRFFGIRGRWPTWSDALAHCPDATRHAWRTQLELRGVWTEPKDGPPIRRPNPLTNRSGISAAQVSGRSPTARRKIRIDPLQKLKVVV